MRLIISEKNNAADKIAAILALGKPRKEAFLKVPYYLFTDADGVENVAVGLKGHVLQVEFPPEYADWRKVEPRDAHRRAPDQGGDGQVGRARGARSWPPRPTRSIIATDYDREGELIGLEALEIAAGENEQLVRTVRRARFSALTPREITEAFASLDHLSEPLARAGEARQDIDLIWGATLTRFVSLATSRLGNQFLSVGRVQSPTLALIVEREKERRAFVPEPYWVVTVDLRPTARTSPPCTRRSASSTRPAPARCSRSCVGPASVTAGQADAPRSCPGPPPSTPRASRARPPPWGMSASSAMRIAEDLYMDGYISYPRTDNTVYPDVAGPARDPGGAALQGVRAGGGRVAGPPQARSPAAARRRPPTTRPSTRPGPPGARRWTTASGRLYELVVRRFFATLADDALSESNRIDLDHRRRAVLPAGLAHPQARLAGLLPLLAAEGRRAAAPDRGRPGRPGRQAPGRQGDPAARPLRPGPADRAHGEAQPGHQGHAAQHHPEPLRPGLHPRQPRRAHRDRHQDGRSSAGVRAPHRLAGDDRPVGEWTWTPSPSGR